MSKKLMLLAAGVLSALALAVIPSAASAGEYEMHCPVLPCVGSVSGTAAEHAIRLETDTGGKFEVSAIEGTIVITQGTATTATTELVFTNVVEKNSGFNFKCNSPGAAAGEIKTGSIPLHFVNLTQGGANPGVLLTSINITYSCAGGSIVRTLTGSLIGALTQANCNVAAATNKSTFNALSGSTQEYEQVTETGSFFDLTSGSHSAVLSTWAVTAQLGITWEAGNKPTLTC